MAVTLNIQCQSVEWVNVAGSCDHGNEQSSSTKRERFLI